MDFSNKYISKTDKITNPTSKKIELSDDAFAIGEILNEICFRLMRSK